MSLRSRLFIVDAMALAFRSFYALGRSSLTTSQGMPTGAVYGAAMFLNKLIGEQRPNYCVAVTDRGETTFRHEIFKSYKATRDKMPNELSQQIPLIFELFSAFKMPLIGIPGVEADDVIGTLAKKHAGPALDVYIVSGDKDFMQLIGPHLFMFAPKKNEEAVIIDEAGVREKFACRPEQVIDALALMGDSVDNVPGVPGIGEKTAAKLIETFGSLDGIYSRIDEIKAAKQRESLLTHRDDAYLSRRLVTLKTDVPIPLSLEQLHCDPETANRNEELLAFYRRFEFKALAKKLESTLGAKALISTDTSSDKEPMAEAALPPIEVLGTESQNRLQTAVQAASVLAIAITASGPDVAKDKAQVLAISPDAKTCFLVPLNEEGIYLVRPLLGDQRTLKLGHGLKNLIQMLGNLALDLGGKLIDLEICDYLLDPNNYNHTLEAMNQRYLGEEPSPLPLAAQTRSMRRLHEAIQPKLADFGLNKVLNDVEMPLVPVLAEMERHGFYIDPELLNAFSDELAVQAARVEKELFTQAGEEFNVNSPRQLQELLFEKLKLQDDAGLKRVKKTKTGLSTDESVLSRLAQHHPVPRLILEYRGITKLKNTYVDPLPQFMNPKTGRVHTSFRQTVAATGRLSSDRPNLQNIPMRSPMGRKIRAAFKPQDPGCVIISADYSQVELRLLAHLAQAEGLIHAFRQGLDIHTVTAAKIFGVPEQEVTPTLRSRAKAVNFGIIYGMGPQRLAAETGVTLSEAKDFIARYFEVYPGIKNYTQGLIESAREKGYCVTIMGRRRPIPEIRERSQVMLARGENIAVNAPIQGSAADIIKLAMIRVHAAFKRERTKASMLLQVHDELVFTAPESEVEGVIPIIREAMEHAVETSVPLKVDIRSGRTWLDAH